jgi:CubicO group peptidase (beta-lactamase class C family)
MVNSWQAGMAVVFALSLLLSDVQAQGPSVKPDVESLIGLWANELTFSPGLAGELAVSRIGSAWRANLANVQSAFEVHGTKISFTFPNNAGAFRGDLAANGNEINGFWMQPAADNRDVHDPSGSGQPFASPLVLQRRGRHQWKGIVRPLERHFTLYLKIFRTPDGLVLGAFRNPEMNSRGGAAQFRVTRDGDSVVFSAGPDPLKPDIRLTASLMNSPERMQIFWSDLGGNIELMRRTPSEVANFFPRPPGEQKYVYTRPRIARDGWVTMRARDVGMNEAGLERLVQRIIDSDPASRRPDLIHSMLIARHGKLVLEEYFFGFDRNTPHDTRSAGKTFSSIMMGAAMRQGAAISPETKLYDVLARMGPFANPDPRKSQITLAHLMTHTSGLACDDNDESSPGGEGKMQMQLEQPNWWKYTLDLPMAHDPGTRYAYCSANINLVGAALTFGTATWLPQLFDRTVARPLGFGKYYWNLMPTGEGYLGGGAFIRSRDLLKVGEAFLDGGVWKQNTIVGPSWVKRSTTSHVKITPETTGLSPQEFPNYYNEGEDGYAWHLSKHIVGTHTYRTYGAGGNGGQMVIVIPDLELVVVFTGGNYGQGGIWGRWASEIVPKEIIGAINKE